ncbi:MAG TPA: amidohydrolase family protein [Terriglobales bacterium]|jgi:imidazolonepropionase-like amidohydrolase|nr:amidohydrolase family protein [Terriglobales bacterium]
MKPSALSTQHSAKEKHSGGHDFSRAVNAGTMAALAAEGLRRRSVTTALLRALTLAACALLCTAAHAQDKPIVLKGGKLLTVSHGTIDNGTVVLQGGKIIAVGPAASVNVPSGAQVVDVTGMTVYPGLIDSETNLGLTEISAENMTNDLVEASDEIMPHMHTFEAFHAESALIPVARMNGITNAVVAPTSEDTLPGQDSFIQLDGASANEMLLIRDLAMPLNFTGDERRNKGGFDKRRFPSTRMGLAAQLRQSFLDAQDYKTKLADYDKKKADAVRDKKPEPSAPKRDLKLEALLPYLEGKKTIVLAANGPSDLQTAVSLANEFKLKYVLNHISHSQPVLDYVASLKVPVIVGPIYEAPKEDERYDAVYSLPAQLYKRGVKIIFASYAAHNVRNLPDEAGYATAFGLPADEALKAITLNAAEIWGVADKLGSLDVGKTANIVVANGDPLDVKTDVKQVYIEGRAVPMTSRQTWLRDQYSK